MATFKSFYETSKADAPDFIPVGQEPWNEAPDTLPKDFDFGHSQGALAQSQSILDNIQKTAFQSPLQNIAAGQSQDNVEVAKGAGKQLFSDISMAGAHKAGPVGAAMLKNAPEFAKNIGAFEEAVKPTNPLQAQGAMLTSVTEALTPVGALKAGAGASPVIGGAIQKTGQVMKGFGKQLYQFLIPRSARESQLLHAYKAGTPFAERFSIAAKGSKTEGPRTLAETAFARGIKGTESSMGVQAKKANQSIWQDVIQPKLKSSKQEIDMDKFFDSVADDIIKKTPELNRQGDLLEGLDALREVYKGKKGTLEDLQKFKEGWAEFVPEKFYKGKNIAGAFGDVKAHSADKARQFIYDALGPEVKEAYIDYGNLKGLEELGQKAMTGGRLKGGFGGFWSAIKDMALTPVATVAGRTIYRTGEGIEFVGEQGAKTLADLAFFKTLAPTQEDTQATQESVSPQWNPYNQ